MDSSDSFHKRFGLRFIWNAAEQAAPACLLEICFEAPFDPSVTDDCPIKVNGSHLNKYKDFCCLLAASVLNKDSGVANCICITL